MYKLGIITAIALTVLMSESVLADCDADFVMALRNQYQEATGGQLADQLFELACTKSVDSKSTNAERKAIGYGDASYGESTLTVRQACAKKDKNFFQQNSRQIASSLLPAEAFELLKGCFPTCRGLSVTTKQSSNLVTVTAEWVDPTSGHTPYAKVRTFTPSGAVKCPDPLPAELRTDAELGNATITCSLLPGGGSSAFVLNTDMRSAFATLNGPTSKVPVIWVSGHLVYDGGAREELENREVEAFYRLSRTAKIAKFHLIFEQRVDGKACTSADIKEDKLNVPEKTTMDETTIYRDRLWVGCQMPSSSMISCFVDPKDPKLCEGSRSFTKQPGSGKMLSPKGRREATCSKTGQAA